MSETGQSRRAKLSRLRSSRPWFGGSPTAAVYQAAFGETWARPAKALKAEKTATRLFGVG